MNKKLFASAIFALGAIVGSTTALGATTGKVGSAVAAAGGGSVRANNLTITSAGTEIAAKSEIIIRLPKGLNFDGAPTYQVTGSSLTLVDDYDGPTLSEPAVELYDTNSDGGMDRAVVVVKNASSASDKVTVSMNVTVGSDVVKGAKKASIAIAGGVGDDQEVVEVLAALAEPVQLVGKLPTAPQKAGSDVSTLASTFIVTIPKGTAGSSTITFTPEKGLGFATSGSAITYSVLTTDYAPFVGAVSASTGTASVSLITSGAPTTALKDDVQVKVTVSAMDTDLVKDTGKRGLALSGAVTGRVDLLDIKANGSTAALVAKAKPTAVVIGSSAAQALPAFTLTENFEGDLGDPADINTKTITITPNKGLVFDTTTPTLSTTGITASVASITASTLEITVTATSATKTLTVSGLKATASKTASGDLSIKVGTPGKNGNSLYVPGSDLVVATATAVGTVDLIGPTAKTISKTGPAGATVTNTITLKETTYGAITRAAVATSTQTSTQIAYVKVTPSSNATIDSVSLAATGTTYPATAPTFGACAKETASTDGSYICEVTGESTSITAGTSSVTVTVGISAKKTAAIGSTLDVTLSGNAGISGTASLANVLVATTASTGVVPDLKPGNTDAVSLAKVSIKENFADGIDASGAKSFRLIAPAGVAFQSAAGASLTVSVVSTFSLNDTLIITPATDTISFTPKVTVADDASGSLSFELVDGNIEGKSGAGITAETLLLGYADGTLKALDAGDDIAIAVGFSAHNAVTGGLADYTVKSSDAHVATAEVVDSNVVVVGVATGDITVTVTDHLGNTASFDVTVSEVAAEPAAEKVVGAEDSEGAGFSAGASTDGINYGSEFTTDDVVTISATVNIAESDQGSAGAIHVAIMSIDADGNRTFTYQDEDGVFQAWDVTAGLPGAVIEAEALEASYDVTVYSGKMTVGKHRIAVAYTTEGGKLIYAPKAIIITVTE